MITVAFALFVVMILAWLAAPDGRAPRKQSIRVSETPVQAVGEPAL